MNYTVGVLGHLPTASSFTQRAGSAEECMVLGHSFPQMTDRSWYINTPAPSPSRWEDTEWCAPHHFPGYYPTPLDQTPVTHSGKHLITYPLLLPSLP